MPVFSTREWIESVKFFAGLHSRHTNSRYYIPALFHKCKLYLCKWNILLLLVFQFNSNISIQNFNNKKLQASWDRRFGWKRIWLQAQWNHGLNHVRVSCGTQEVELRTDMLQQHAAFIGGTNAATCPLCHKFFLGGEALVEHMKLHHKDPPSSGVTSKLYWHLHKIGLEEYYQ